MGLLHKQAWLLMGLVAAAAGNVWLGARTPPAPWLVMQSAANTADPARALDHRAAELNAFDAIDVADAFILRDAIARLPRP